MAEQKSISQLPNGLAIGDNDFVPMVQNGTTYKVLASAFNNYIVALRPANLSALVGVTSASDKLFYFNGSGTGQTTDFTPQARVFNAAATVVLQRAALELGAVALDSVVPLQRGGTGATTAVAARTNLGLGTGATANPSSGGQAISALTYSADQIGYATGAAAAAVTALTPFARTLIDDANAPTARATLGVVSTPWANLTLQAGWTTITGRRTAYRSLLDTVQLEIQISGGTATDQTVIGVLPVSWRPAFPITLPVTSGPNTALSSTVPGPRVLIDTTGEIKIVNCSATQVAAFLTFATV